MLKIFAQKTSLFLRYKKIKKKYYVGSIQNSTFKLQKISKLPMPRTLVNNGILLPKLFWPTVRKNCSSDREKLLKFETEGREFAKLLRSLAQFIQTVQWKQVRTIFEAKCFFNYNFSNRMFFLTCSWMVLRSDTLYFTRINVVI